MKNVCEIVWVGGYAEILEFLDLLGLALRRAWKDTFFTIALVPSTPIWIYHSCRNKNLKIYSRTIFIIIAHKCESIIFYFRCCFKTLISIYRRLVVQRKIFQNLWRILAEESSGVTLTPTFFTGEIFLMSLLKKVVVLSYIKGVVLHRTLTTT